METNSLFERVLKDNEIIKGQLNNLQTSIQLLKNNMIESQNNKNNINFSSLLDDLNISSSIDEVNKEDGINVSNKNETNYNNKNEILFNIMQETKGKNYENNNINNKYTIIKEPDKVDNKNKKGNVGDNIHKRNIKKLLKEKEVINRIYLLKENYNNYNNYNIYNKSSQESSAKTKKEMKINNKNNNIVNKKTIFIEGDEINNNNIKNIKNNKFNNNKIFQSAKKEKRTNSMLNINLRSNKKHNNQNKQNIIRNNSLRYSFDEYYHKNESCTVNNKNDNKNAINKRVEILNYLKEINNLQNIISQLKKENSLLKNSLEKEKQKNKKFRKITEEIINYFEKTK